MNYTRVLFAGNDERRKKTKKKSHIIVNPATHARFIQNLKYQLRDIIRLNFVGKRDSLVQIKAIQQTQRKYCNTIKIKYYSITYGAIRAFTRTLVSCTICTINRYIHKIRAHYSWDAITIG